MSSPPPLERAASILIVDDEDAIRRTLRRILQGQYSVDDAATVAEARQKLSDRHFDLLLCDVTMSSVSGLELVATLAGESPGTVVVMVTGHDDMHIAEAALALGVYGYLVKPFTTNEIRITVASALRRRALELERSKTEEQERKLRLLADRERIGRDLHDNVIQRLFASGLALQSASRVADPDTRARVDVVVDDLDLTVRLIRSAIFDIESQGSSSVRGLVLELAHETTRTLGFEPVVEFVGAVDTLISGCAADQLMATLRESLSNVVRHAAATHVDVIVVVGPDITLTVRDDGVGIDRAGGAGRGGSGVANMDARARRLGGQLTLRRRPTGGTELEWRIPLESSAQHVVAST